MVVLLLLLSLVACESWTQRGAKGVGLLPKASAEETNFSQYQPQKPYAQLAPGVLTRTLFEASSGQGYRVEVRDLLVGPRKHTESASLPGTAVFDIRSGTGLIVIGGKLQDLKPGSTFTVPEGNAFTIENKSDEGIAIRAHLFMSE